MRLLGSSSPLPVFTAANIRTTESLPIPGNGCWQYGVSSSIEKSVASYRDRRIGASKLQPYSGKCTLEVFGFTK